MVYIRQLSLEKAAREYAAQVHCERLCVTAGARGAGLLDSGPMVLG